MSVARPPRLSDKSTESAWEKAMREGAVTIDEFIEEGRRLSREQFAKTKGA